MSQENVEAVRRMWDAWQAGDVQTALSFYDPDVEWDGTNLPDGDVARGHEAILDHIRRWAEQWDDWTVEVERIVDAGSEQVVLFMRERGRSKSGLDMDERHAELYTCRDGKVIRRQGFSDPDQALKAAGLRE
jgi:ketosteroid isomerase-like protein